ncbi:MAG: alpha/beta hydrolase [Chloroflexota bacterium]
MPAPNDSQLVPFQGWTLRLRPASETPARLMLMLHGWTGDENSMWVFGRDLPSHFWLLAPRAPHAAQPGGYSWRPHVEGTHGRPSAEMLRPAAEALIRLVDAYSASVGVDAAQFDVMGFSQGAAMTNLLSLLYPQRIRRVGVLAGFVPGGAEDLVAQRPLTAKPFFVAHGTQDELVPIERARESIALLEAAGAQVTYCQAEVGHKVSADCLRAMKKFFQE